MAKVGDKYILHSSNGMDYSIEIISASDYRPPEEKYGVDVYDGNGIYAGDVMFIGDEFLSSDKVELIDGEEEEDE